MRRSAAFVKDVNVVYACYKLSFARYQIVFVPCFVAVILNSDKFSETLIFVCC